MLLTCLLLAGLTPPPLTSEELDRVVHGEILARSEASAGPGGKTRGYGVGAIAIERSLDATWQVMANYTDKAEYQPRVTSCTVLDAHGNDLHVAIALKVAWTSVHYTGFFVLDPGAHTIRWRLDKEAKGNTINDMDGGYTLLPVTGNLTVVYLRSYVDSGTLVPQFLQDAFTSGAIPDNLKAIKKRVESGGQYHK